MQEASPWPVTSPNRAASSWTAAASGSVTTVIHRRPSPNAAPTCEYLPMPDGLSPTAEVTFVTVKTIDSFDLASFRPILQRPLALVVHVPVVPFGHFPVTIAPATTA